MPWTAPAPAARGRTASISPWTPGQTLGVVGESGCGKSTLARALIRMVPGHGTGDVATAEDLLALSPRQMKPYRAEHPDGVSGPAGQR